MKLASGYEILNISSLVSCTCKLDQWGFVLFFFQYLAHIGSLNQTVKNLEFKIILRSFDTLIYNGKFVYTKK